MRTSFKFIFIGCLLFIIAITAKQVLAQENNNVLYVPLIGITAVPDPLALPNGAGPVTYRYSVKNFLSGSALSNIYITDTGCSSVTFETGDDNNNFKLDQSETWKYTCTTQLNKTTTSMATVTGTAFNIIAKHKAWASVIVGSDNPPPLVNIINVTKVAYPLSLPKEGGEITYTYRVSNPGVVPLQSVVVADDECNSISSKLGDTNGNNLLDINEVWLYTCTTILKQTTTNTATVTAFANGLQATGEATITIKVDSPNDEILTKFPNLGQFSNSKVRVWTSLVTILIGLLIILGLINKIKVEKNIKR